MLELLYAPMLVFLAAPPVAFVPAFIFGGWYLRTRVRHRPSISLSIAAVLWLIYGVYEIRMFMWSRTVVAPIRIDMLLIAPVLYVATAVAVLRGWQRAATGR